MSVGKVGNCGSPGAVACCLSWPVQQQSHPPGSVPSLAPPPPIAPRRNAPTRANTVPAVEVGRRLQNLQLDNMEDVFDDTFDPRAEKESKKTKEYDPFGDDFLDDILRTGDSASRATIARAEAKHPTAEDFQVMIDKVDKRLVCD
uniref:EF-hand domain-containing protein n=1 Tax=Angiostrongylus cantonensis TaxID=6313 RepID=A0A0K0D5Y1_ANGCA